MEKPRRISAGLRPTATNTGCVGRGFMCGTRVRRQAYLRKAWHLPRYDSWLLAAHEATAAALRASLARALQEPKASMLLLLARTGMSPCHANVLRSWSYAERPGKKATRRRCRMHFEDRRAT